MQYNFVLQVKSQDILLPPPHGQLAPCLVAPPIAFNDEVCAWWINFITDNWLQIYWVALKVRLLFNSSLLNPLYPQHHSIKYNLFSSKLFGACQWPYSEMDWISKTGDWSLIILPVVEWHWSFLPYKPLQCRKSQHLGGLKCPEWSTLF